MQQHTHAIHSEGRPPMGHRPGRPHGTRQTDPDDTSAPRPPTKMQPQNRQRAAVAAILHRLVRGQRTKTPAHTHTHALPHTQYSAHTPLPPRNRRIHGSAPTHRTVERRTPLPLRPALRPAPLVCPSALPLCPAPLLCTRAGARGSAARSADSSAPAALRALCPVRDAWCVCAVCVCVMVFTCSGRGLM